VQAAGFLPGELVAVQLHGSSQVLARVTAGPDGSARADVPIPGGTGPGAATVLLTGTESENVANVDLRVAAARIPLAPSGGSDPVPLAAAALALVAATGGLISVVGGRGSLSRRYS
jgi:hypothetical protein